jgi:hypothetical protein
MIREARSPWSTGSKPDPANTERGVKHSAVYGQRGDATPKPPAPPRGSAPGELVDGQITITKGANNEQRSGTI